MRQLRLVTARRHQKFAGDNGGSLMDKLIEGMLPIGARLAPDDRPRRVAEAMPVHRHALAVRLHFELLQIGRKTAKPLIIGEYGAGRITAGMCVPEPDQRQHDRHVTPCPGSAEVNVHRLGTAQEIGKGLGSDGDHQREADRPPDGIAPADPILEAKDAGGVNAPFRRLFGRRGQRNKLRPRIIDAGGHPFSCGGRVGHRLGRGKGLGRDQYQRTRRIQPRQRIGYVCAIHVGHEMAARPVRVGRQRAHSHVGAQMRSTDADIDHIGERAACPVICAAAHHPCKGFHPRQCPQHARHDIGAIHDDRPSGQVPQRGMQHGAVFRLVDGRAGEHSLPPLRHATLINKCDQRRAGIRVDCRLGVIQKKPVRLDREVGSASGAKEGSDAPSAGLFGQHLQITPHLRAPNARWHRPEGRRRVQSAHPFPLRAPMRRAWHRR